VPPQITKTPQARRDLLDIAGYIARDNLDAALRLLDAAEAAFELLGRSPEMAALCHFRAPEAAGSRVWSIKGFENYCIVYRPIP